jgi:hypothetical protein
MEKSATFATGPSNKMFSDDLKMGKAGQYVRWIFERNEKKKGKRSRTSRYENMYLVSSRDDKYGACANVARPIALDTEWTGRRRRAVAVDHFRADMQSLL